jgi:fermentation-respiration switch protein FrsA (DUF1100 family)
VSLAYFAGLNIEGAPVEPVPDVPSLYVAGSADAIASLDRVEQAFDTVARAPKRFAVLDGVTHLGFMDVCTIAADQGGVLNLASSYGVNVNPVVLRLFADGCADQYTPAEDAWPAIRHLTVAMLRASMGIDPEPVGLDPSLDGAYDVGVAFRDDLG